MPKKLTNEVKEALDGIRDECLAVKEDEYRPIRLDLDLAALVGLRVSENAKEDKALFEKYLKELFKPSQIPRLEQFSLGLIGAQLEYENTLSTDSQKQIQEQVPRARKVRKDLLALSGLLWSENADVEKRLRKIREGRGYVDLSKDCLGLVELYHDFEDKMDAGAKKNFQYNDLLKESASVGNTLFKLLSDAEGVKKSVRDGAWTLFLTCYEDVQECGLFLANRLGLSDPEGRYPSLFGEVRGMSQSSSKPEQESDTPSENNPEEDPTTTSE